jgi:NADPH:quinone reductase-like Zn-dependent oxidoreductase
MYDAGKLTPKIHQVFSLADTGAALRSLVDRQAIGKVVVRTRDY